MDEYNGETNDPNLVVAEKTIENIFPELPSDLKLRKKEQVRRNRIKDRLSIENPDHLIIDGYVSNDETIYTNTIIVTKRTDDWQNSIHEIYKESIIESKQLKNGNQITINVEEGSKPLIFNFYPKKYKMTTHGSQKGISQWIKLFKDISSLDNQIDTATELLDNLDNSLTHTDDISDCEEPRMDFLNTDTKTGEDDLELDCTNPKILLSTIRKRRTRRSNLYTYRSNRNNHSPKHHTVKKTKCSSDKGFMFKQKDFGKN